MAFRDDRDALLARADALQREHDRLEAALSGASSERDELRAALAENEKELARLRAKVAPTPEDLARRAQKRRAYAVGAGVSILFALGVMFTLTSRGATPSAPQPQQAVQVAAPSAQAAADHDKIADKQIGSVRACLNGADLDARSLELGPDQYLDVRLKMRLDACDQALQAMRAAGVVSELPSVEIHEYAEAFTAWREPALALMRHYDEGDHEDDGGARARELGTEVEARRAALIAASHRLRAAAAPALAAQRARRIATHETRGQPIAAAAYEMSTLAEAFVAAFIAPEPSLDQIEAALTALSAFRDAHPDLESNAIGAFFKFGKQLVRALRAAGSPVMTTGHLHEFRMMTTYFGLAGLDR